MIFYLNTLYIPDLSNCEMKLIAARIFNVTSYCYEK